ncbi:MAG: DUF4363 family protein [Bacillota bacterium]|jgi:hypothetical protein
MTKAYIFITVAIIIILAVSIGSLYYLHISADNIAIYFKPLEKAINREDWTEAQNYFSQSKALWPKYSRIWPLLIDHQKVSEISKLYLRLEQAINNQDILQAEQSLQELSYMVKQIPEAESITWQNIL